MSEINSRVLAEAVIIRDIVFRYDMVPTWVGGPMTSAARTSRAPILCRQYMVARCEKVEGMFREARIPSRWAMGGVLGHAKAGPGNPSARRELNT